MRLRATSYHCKIAVTGRFRRLLSMRANLKQVMKEGVFLGACLPVGLVAYLLLLYPHDIHRVIRGSSLENVIRPEGPGYNGSKIRAAILEQLPVGAAPREMKTFLTKHFDGVPYAIEHHKLSWAPRPSTEAYVRIRAIDVTTLAGGESVDVYLLLDPSEHLQDVLVTSHRDYL